MPSYSRELTLLGLLGATLVLPQCSLLTKVDWTTIPPAGGASNGGSSGGNSGEAGALPQAGQAGVGGLAGEGGMAGESGEGGAAGDSEISGGSGGSLGGSAGRGGSGGGGTSGAGGGAPVGGAPSHTTCSEAPTPPTTIPDLSQKIVLFDGGTGMNGDRKGRAGLDQACKDAKIALHLPHSGSAAVISVDAVAPMDTTKDSDQIVTMAMRYGIPADDVPVVSPIGMDFSPSWNLLWSNMAALPSLVCTGIMPPAVRTWLTGSNGRQAPLVTNGTAYFGYLDASTDTTGAKFANACNGWTLGTGSLSTKAHVGSTIADHDAVADGHPRFIDLRNVECNAADSNILCVAFNPVP